MKKIVGILVCMLLIICGISYSVAAFSFNKNSQLDDEKVLTSINDPLSIRAEVKEIGYRKVTLSAYATNTLDEQIKVHWSSKPCLFGVFYLVPNEEDLGVLVYNPYNRNIFQFIPTVIKFESGEEKLIQTSVFFGISNWILPGLSRGYQKYIPSFPWLPDGDYRFDVYLNPYFIGNEYPQYHDLVNDTVFFHFGA
ncbi:MAG: hypothetical protein MUO82_00925 [Candidatus Thermoplasmatota archaeon]|nr:hypothetical protein [Candidatus Thermoplasmatota archaeon]